MNPFILYRGVFLPSLQSFFSCNFCFLLLVLFFYFLILQYQGFLSSISILSLLNLLYFLLCSFSLDFMGNLRLAVYIRFFLVLILFLPIPGCLFFFFFLANILLEHSQSHQLCVVYDCFQLQVT